MLTPSLLTLELARLHQAELLADAARPTAPRVRMGDLLHLAAEAARATVDRARAVFAERTDRPATTIACATC